MSINPRVIELVAEWEELREQGTAIPLEDLCGNEPELLPEVRRCVGQEERFQALLGGATPNDVGQPTSPDLLRIEGYEILERIGHGGMGVVYKARHEQLNRLVALKVVLGGGHARGADLVRFQAEARAVAQLQHPHIVQLFDSGQHHGLPFFTLELVGGGSLAERLRGTPLQPHDAAALVERLALGVDYAHQHGVVHRDLKPANVLLTADGTPKVTDFGLAKRHRDEPGESAPGELTASGAVLGTPSYMAPEQASGQSKHVGPLADVYALGAILYECLTGAPPFRGPTPLDTLIQVVSREPVPATQVQPQVPRDLETICLKCLHKEPTRRYASAAALAEDLRRFQAGEPIVARPVGAVERAAKWVRRRPAVAGLSGALAAVVVVAFAVVLSALLEATWARDQAEAERKETKKQRDQAEAERRETKKQLDSARAHLFTAQLWRVAAVWEREADAGYKLLHDYNACPIDQRDFAWGWYEARCRGQQERPPLKGHTAALRSVAFSPDGKALASAGGDRTIKLWDAATGQQRAALRGHTNGVVSVAFSPDGKTLASASLDETIKLWDVASGQQRATLRGHAEGVVSVTFSPDGKTLASSSWDRTIKLWDAATGQQRAVLRGHTASVVSAAFSPDGKTLASSSWDRTIKLWDVVSGQERTTLQGHNNVIWSVAFSPDGKTLASASDDRTIKLWDVASGQERAALQGHGGPVLSLAFSRDGKSLASASDDRTVKLWHVATGQERAALRGHTDAVWSVAFSRDGKALASASNDRTVKLWHVATGQQRAALQGHNGPVLSVAFSRDGKALASAGLIGPIKLWDVATGQQRAALRGHTGAVPAVTFSPDGKTLASASWGQDPRTKARWGEIKLWDVGSGRQRAAFQGHTNAIWSLAFSPDGKTLASACDDGTIKLWDAASGQERTTLQGHTYAVRSLVFSPDGKTLASASWGQDRKTMARWGEIKLWDVATGQQRATLRGHAEGVVSVTFSPDGKTLASSSWDRTIKLWDAASGQQRTTLRGHTDPVLSVSFSPDGKTLASASGREDPKPEARRGEIKLWDVATGQQRSAFQGHTASVLSVVCSPDGKTLASGSEDQTVRLWELSTVP